MSTQDLSHTPARPDCIEQYTLFETCMGTCGIAWSAVGVTRLQLPEADRAATEARLAARRGAPTRAPLPAFVMHAITALQRYFAGRPTDLADVALDLDAVPPFHRAIYDAARTLRWGDTTTYGGLARMAGSPHAARAVGQAMARNPVPIIVPCHRVLADGGRIGGFSAFGGTLTKQRLLALEGAATGTLL